MNKFGKFILGLSVPVLLAGAVTGGIYANEYYNLKNNTAVEIVQEQKEEQGQEQQVFKKVGVYSPASSDSAEYNFTLNADHTFKIQDRVNHEIFVDGGTFTDDGTTLTLNLAIAGRSIEYTWLNRLTFVGEDETYGGSFAINEMDFNHIYLKTGTFEYTDEDDWTYDVTLNFDYTFDVKVIVDGNVVATPHGVFTDDGTNITATYFDEDEQENVTLNLEWIDSTSFASVDDPTMIYEKQDYEKAGVYEWTDDENNIVCQYYLNEDYSGRFEVWENGEKTYEQSFSNIIDTGDYFVMYDVNEFGNIYTSFSEVFWISETSCYPNPNVDAIYTRTDIVEYNPSPLI